jgi:hypothetical protein
VGHQLARSIITEHGAPGDDFTQTALDAGSSPSKTQLRVPQPQLQSMVQRARAPLPAPSMTSESSSGDVAFPSLQPAPLGCSGAGSRSLPAAYLLPIPVSRSVYTTASTTRPLSSRSTAVVSAATTDEVAGSGQAAFPFALSSLVEIVAPAMVPSARLASRPSRNLTNCGPCRVLPSKLLCRLMQLSWP